MNHTVAVSQSQILDSVQRAHASLESQPDAVALFDRALTALMRELLDLREGLSAAGRDRVLLAQDDKTLLAELMIQALEADPLAPKALRLRLRGQAALNRLLEESGGVLGAGEVARLLGITQDAVRKRAKRGTLLALGRGGRQVYPAFQLDPETRGLVPGVAEVLPQLATDSAVAKLRFFLTRAGDLDAAPIDLLRRGDAESRALVERKARQFGVHLAA